MLELSSKLSLHVWYFHVNGEVALGIVYLETRFLGLRQPEQSAEVVVKTIRIASQKYIYHHFPRHPHLTHYIASQVPKYMMPSMTGNIVIPILYTTLPSSPWDGGGTERSPYPAWDTRIWHDVYSKQHLLLYCTLHIMQCPCAYLSLLLQNLVALRDSNCTAEVHTWHVLFWPCSDERDSCADLSVSIVGTNTHTHVQDYFSFESMWWAEQSGGMKVVISAL